MGALHRFATLLAVLTLAGAPATYAQRSEGTTVATAQSQPGAEKVVRVANGFQAIERQSAGVREGKCSNCGKYATGQFCAGCGVRFSNAVYTYTEYRVTTTKQTEIADIVRRETDSYARLGVAEKLTDPALLRKLIAEESAKPKPDVFVRDGLTTRLRVVQPGALKGSIRVEVRYKDGKPAVHVGVAVAHPTGDGFTNEWFGMTGNEGFCVFKDLDVATYGVAFSKEKGTGTKNYGSLSGRFNPLKTTRTVDGQESTVVLEKSP